MPKKYIELDAALSALGEEPYVWNEDSDSEVQEYMDWERHYNAISAIPTADVVEVRHGRWHRFSKGSGSYNGGIILSDAFQCTVCKESFWNKSNYCPSCGAKMDGGKG